MKSFYNQRGRAVFLLSAALVMPAFHAFPQDSIDSLKVVEIVGSRHSSLLRGSISDTLTWNMNQLRDMPKILGNSDPLHYAQSLPGIQTNNEYDAGLHVQGCDNEHNMVSIAGVPLYNVSHILGFFSLFNVSHFSSMRLVETPNSASAPNRLGAALIMDLPDSLLARMHLDVSVGPISSQGTAKIPVGKKSALFLSARGAYINLLYGRWLKIDGAQINYSFADANVTYLYQPNKRNKIWTDFYTGYDDVGYDDGKNGINTSLDWGNRTIALHWLHISEDYQLKQSVYNTYYHSSFGYSEGNMKFNLPSYIYDFGYKADFAIKALHIGMDVATHTVQPQNPQMSGSYNVTTSSQSLQHSQEFALYTDYNLALSEKWAAEAGVRGSLYHVCCDDWFCSADPNLSLTYSPITNRKWVLRGYERHQYLFQTGFSSMGLPTEFWFSANSQFHPQSELGSSLTYEMDIFADKFHLSVGAYYRQLYHQLEYVGDVFDFVNSAYSLDKELLYGNGENYGLTLMFHKVSGPLTGWLSYSFGRSLRRFASSDYPKEYPSNHERIHELNVVESYKLGKHWSVGSTFVLATGTPFTAPKCFYLLNGHLVSEYGEHNANRLKPYHRLDLSVNYLFKSKQGHERDVNFSLYNIALYDNDLYYALYVYKKGSFKYQPFHFMMRFMPSLSFHYKF